MQQFVIKYQNYKLHQTVMSYEKKTRHIDQNETIASYSSISKQKLRTPHGETEKKEVLKQQQRRQHELEINFGEYSLFINKYQIEGNREQGMYYCRMTCVPFLLYSSENNSLFLFFSSLHMILFQYKERKNNIQRMLRLQNFRITKSFQVDESGLTLRFNQPKAK